MKLHLRFAVGCLLILSFAFCRPVSAESKQHQRRVLIISIDGCRPDVLLRADMPNTRALMRHGSFTFYAETTDLAVTLPSHASMLTGVTPETHGVTFNSESDADPRAPTAPTLFQIAHQHGLSTAIFSTKSKFRIFMAPGAIDYSFIAAEPSSSDDLAIAERAAETIRTNHPDVMLLHLGNTDRTGHHEGWGSAAQLEALAAADKAIGVVIDALKSAGLESDALIIETSDHGGAGLSHGAGDPRSRYIPWIAAGPGVRKDFDLTLERDLTVHTEDTFATALEFLGLPIPAGIVGKPLEAAFKD